ncbi:hypothetical protein BRADO3925 [Bradyrhizobium sp. ORS 278]|nr:hypothetical protein BRADO3925 [Bradyrhizobium sp. ORS 278]
MHDRGVIARPMKYETEEPMQPGNNAVGDAVVRSHPLASVQTTSRASQSKREWLVSASFA